MVGSGRACSSIQVNMCRGQSRMSSSITLPLRTFTKGPPLFSSTGWPESSGDLSAPSSNVWLQAHTTTLGFLHDCLGFKPGSLGLQGRGSYPLTQNNSSPSLLTLCSDLSVLKPTMEVRR